MNLFKRIFGKKEDKRDNTIISVERSGLDDTFLFDFKNYQSGYNNTGFVISGTFAMSNSEGGTEPDLDPSDLPSYVEKSPKKIAVKPIDVLNELETIPTPWNMSNLDDKISILEYKRDLIVQKYSKREVEGLLERLHNRKKYHKFKDFFESFQNTTDEKIDALLAKYDLVMQTSDLFVPEFPDIAIKTMKEYSDKMASLCDKKPVFYVIAEPDKFKKAYEKRDPILLVQSPFGFYWQILGAWDKEMILLSEL